MPTPTYTPIASTTLSSATQTVTFSSIPATYRDLIVIVDCSATANTGVNGIRLNGDSGANYSQVAMLGNGSSALSYTSSGNTSIFTETQTSTNRTNTIINIMDYSATNKHKSLLIRGNNSATGTDAVAARWANTAAVTSLEVRNTGITNFSIGSVFSLYGVIA